jgi:hypothetical protein
VVLNLFFMYYATPEGSGVTKNTNRKVIDMGKVYKQFTPETVNEWAEKYLEEARFYVEWANQEKVPGKKKEIYDMSEGLRELLEIFYGYRGANSKNFVEHLISKYWYDLRDESIFIETVWQAIKDTILDYDSSQEASFSTLLHRNIRNAIYKAFRNKTKIGEHQIPISCMGTLDEDGNYIELDIEDVENNYSIEADNELQESVDHLLGELNKDKRANTEKQKFIINFIIQDQIKGYIQTEKHAFEKQKPGAKRQPRIGYNAKLPRRLLAKELTEKFGGSLRANEDYIDRFRERAKKALGNRLNTTYPKSTKELAKRNKEKFFNKQVYQKNKEYEEYLEKFKVGLVGKRYVI